MSTLHHAEQNAPPPRHTVGPNYGGVVAGADAMSARHGWRMGLVLAAVTYSDNLMKVIVTLGKAAFSETLSQGPDGRWRIASIVELDPSGGLGSLAK